jgi:threonine/homoserine/homoserine lactone efflux protein
VSALVRGVVLGFCLAAPVGPIGLLCIQRTLARGRLVGFVSGLGAATADAAYGLIAGLGLGAAQRFLVAHAMALRVGGAAFLVYLGVQTLRARPARAAATAADAATAPGGAGLLRAWLETLALTLSNPMTILSFAALIAGAMPAGAQSAGAIARFVVGVFAGSAAWWLTLALGTGALRGVLGAATGGGAARLRVVNVAAGVAILGFAAATLWQLRAG